MIESPDRLHLSSGELNLKGRDLLARVNVNEIWSRDIKKFCPTTSLLLLSSICFCLGGVTVSKVSQNRVSPFFLSLSLHQHLHFPRPLQARGQRHACIETRTLAITLPLNFHLVHILSPVFQTGSSILSKNSTWGICQKLLTAAFLTYSVSRSDMRHFCLFFIVSTNFTPCYLSF